MSLYSPQGFIFIHNRKTGGTSLRNLLTGPLVRYLTIPHESAHGTLRHMRGIGAEGVWNLAFKFAFVRNPYTWVESMRRHAIAQRDHPLRIAALGDVLEWPRTLADACWAEQPTTDGALLFQRDMVLGERDCMILDRLCRYENYHDEVAWLLDNLGIGHPGILPTVGITKVPTVEPSGSYAKAIAEHFAEDFKALSYTP